MNKSYYSSVAPAPSSNRNAKPLRGAKYAHTFKFRKATHAHFEDSTKIKMPFNPGWWNPTKSLMGMTWGKATYRRKAAARRRRGTYRRSSFGRRFRKGYNRTGGFYGRYNRKGAYSRGVQPELKFFDTTISASPVPSTGVFQNSLVIIPQGDGQSNRDGRKIQVKSLTTHMHFVLDTVASASLAHHDTILVKLVLDTQVNGALPLALDYVVDSTNSLTFRNLANSQRFKTLWARSVNLFPHAAAGDGSTNDSGEYAIDMTVHIKVDVPIYYNASASTGAISTQESNGLFLYFQSRHGEADIFTQTRMRFYG